MFLSLCISTLHQFIGHRFETNTFLLCPPMIQKRNNICRAFPTDLCPRIYRTGPCIDNKQLPLCNSQSAKFRWHKHCSTRLFPSATCFANEQLWYRSHHLLNLLLCPKPLLLSLLLWTKHVAINTVLRLTMMMVGVLEKDDYVVHAKVGATSFIPANGASFVYCRTDRQKLSPRHGMAAVDSSLQFTRKSNVSVFVDRLFVSINHHEQTKIAMFISFRFCVA